MPPPEIGRPAALGERERATGQKEGRLSVSNHSASGKTERLSADEWRMLLNMRFGSLKRLMADRVRKCTLTNAQSDLLRKEMTWARIHRGDKPEAVMRWLVVSVPMYAPALLAAMTPDERSEAREKQTAAFCALIKWARKRKNWLRPLAMGNRLEVTPEEREALKLRTIRYAGQTDDIMALEQRRRNRERKAASRRAEGKPTRAQWRAGCLTATEPWLAEGISRRTWERRQKKAAMQAVSDVSQVVPQYKEYIPSSYIGDTLATAPATASVQPVRTVQGRALDGAPDHTAGRDISGSQRDIPPGLRDIECHRAESIELNSDPRNRASGFASRQRASDAPSRVPLRAVQPAPFQISGAPDAATIPTTTTEACHVE